MTHHVETIRRFFDALDRLDLDAITAFFTEDGVYHDLPVPTDPTVGHEGIRRKLGFVAEAIDRLEIQLGPIIGNGDIVMAERVEVWHFPTGEKPRLPVMSIFELRGGKISAWREYWDLNTLISQLPPSFVQAMAKAQM